MSIKRQLILLIVIFIMSTIIVEFVNINKLNSIVKRQKLEDTPNLIQQIENNVRYYSDDIARIALSISYNKNLQNLLVTSDKWEQYELYSRLDNFMANTKVLKDNINGISVASQDSIISFNESENLNWIKEYSSFSKPVFTPIRKNENNRNDYNYYYILPIFDTESEKASFAKIGTLIINLNVRHFKEIFSTLALPQNYWFFIVDSQDTVVASTNASLLYKSYHMQVTDEGGSSTIDVNGDRYIYSYKVVDGLGWKIISLIPVNELTKGIDSVKKFTAIMMLTVLIILIIISTTIVVNITKPIRQISRFTSTLSKNINNQRLQITANNELKLIMTYINNMLDHKEEMTKQLLLGQENLYQSELNQKQAQLKYLQSQINPHFLYNTLECIRSIAQVNQTTEISDIAVCLAHIFRYSINSPANVKVKDELECVTHYFKIIEIRYKGRFSLHIQCEEAVGELMIINMLLQPLVENAVYHGLETRRGAGTIWIAVQTDQNELRITVSDDGRGIEQEKLQRLAASLDTADGNLHESGRKSLGLLNINSRIKYVYGSAYGLSVESNIGHGTIVTLRFPKYVSDRGIRDVQSNVD